MAVELNHTIVPSRDKSAAARFLAEILGLPDPVSFGHFVCVEVANGVTLDYDDREDFEPGHYAFLVAEEDFDSIFRRVQERRLAYWADPGHRRINEINGNGRGFYFSDPSGHNMEVLTRPYGS